MPVRWEALLLFTNTRGVVFMQQNPCNWRHFEAESILPCVGWCLR
jgi:hypothetical protein